MRSGIAGILAALACLAALAGCGDDGDTTVINQTTTVTESSSTTASSSTTESTTSTAADDGADESGPVLSLKSFQAPSGNIACAMTGKSARCDIAEKDWSAPRPADCPSQVDSGQGLTLNATGAAQVVCAGDTVLNPDAPTLEYGSTSQIGAIVCASMESGVSCTNSSGGAFTLSRESYDLN